MRPRPQGEVLDQADFLNACLSRDRPRAGGAAGGGQGGRGRAGPRAGRAAPRSAPDRLDVLLLGDLDTAREVSSCPIRDIAERRFVLEPLLELDPALKLPDGTPLAPLLEACRAACQHGLSRTDCRKSPQGGFTAAVVGC